MATPTVETDGRRARRDRNRAAVIDAMITLLLEDGSIPPTERIAERAGVSVSSVFRYFESLEDLQQQTVETHFERFGQLFDIPSLGEGSLDTRIARFVDARATLHAAVAPIARIARAKQSERSPISERLAAIRDLFIDQVRVHFAEELSTRTGAEHDDLADAVDALTSFEAWDLLHSARGRSDRQIRRTWRTTIHSLLSFPE